MKTLFIFFFVNFVGLISCVRVTTSGCKVDDSYAYDCTNLSLTDVPEDLNPNAVSINLLRNNLREIKNLTFWKYPLLESLSLSHNQIENIEDNSFEYLKNLQSMDLWNNKLTRFDQRFSNWIRSIALNNNPLTHVNIPRANIGYLGMINCSLTRLPNLGPLPKLTILAVYGNNFEEIRAVDIAPFCYLDKFNVRSSEFKNTKTYENCECEKLRLWLRKKRIDDHNQIQCSTNLSCSTEEYDFSEEEKLWNECMDIRSERHLRI